MSDKNEIIDIISSGKRIPIYQKESSDYYSPAKIKEDLFFGKSINPNELKRFHSLFSNVYKNSKFISNNISIFPDFYNIELFFSIISKFFIIYIILNYYHEIQFVDLFVCFTEIILYNSNFMIYITK